MSLFNISYMAGIACAPALGGAINDGATNLLNLQGLHQKQPSFYACAVLFAITSLVAYRILPEGKPVTNEISPESTEELSLEGGFNLIEFRKMLSQMPSVLWLAFTIFMGVGPIMSYAKPIICQHFAISEWEYGSMMLLPAFIVGTVSFPLGTLGDKIGKVKAIRIGLGLATLGFWLALAFPSLHMILGFGVVIGIGYVIAYPSVFAYVSETCDSNQRGAAIGAVGTAQGLGAIIGNPISSLLVKQGAFKMFGIFPIPEGGLIFLACGIMLMVSFLISLFGLKTKQVPLTSL